MYRTLSSRLTAHFHVNGTHLDAYLLRKPEIRRSLCEDLILHDQICIPVQDYLTAVGLVMVVGERGVLELLERKRIRFVRTRGVPVYLRGTGTGGALGQIESAGKKIAAECTIDEAVDAALHVVPIGLRDAKKLRLLLIESSAAEEWTELIDRLVPEAVEDFKRSPAWRERFLSAESGMLALPGVDRGQGKVFRPQRDLHKKPVDALLALLHYNANLLLARRHGCADISPSFPICDLIELKTERISQTPHDSKKLWDLLELAGVPDFSDIELNDGRVFSDFVEAVSGRNAAVFRQWFQDRTDATGKDLQKEYVSELRKVPAIQRLPSKVVRFVLATSASLLGAAVGGAAGILDSFVVEHLFRQKSPKFFLDELAKVRGDLAPTSGQGNERRQKAKKRR